MCNLFPLDFDDRRSSVKSSKYVIAALDVTVMEESLPSLYAKADALRRQIEEGSAEDLQVFLLAGVSS